MYSEGNIIRGRYRLERRIGEGGMATVWRAMHVALHRPVALKLVHRSDREPQETVQRFLREARVAASIRHRHVVSILDFGIAEDASPFIAMELLEGESLSERLARDRVLDLADAAVVFDQVLGGLAAVHDAAIIHRDLKPENIFLVRDSDGIYVKLLDFGVSRAAASNREIESVYDTQYNLIVGTPHYMAPEQARGESAVDHRADLYAAGVMLYEALSGVAPFDADNLGDLLSAIATRSPPPLQAHRPDLVAVSNLVSHAMSRDCERRFQTARQMRLALREVLGPEMVARAALYPPMLALTRGSGSEPPATSRKNVPTRMEPGSALALRANMTSERFPETVGPLRKKADGGRLFAALSAAILLLVVAGSAVSVATDIEKPALEPGASAYTHLEPRDDSRARAIEPDVDLFIPSKEKVDPPEDPDPSGDESGVAKAPPKQTSSETPGRPKRRVQGNQQSEARRAKRDVSRRRRAVVEKSAVERAPKDGPSSEEQAEPSEAIATEEMGATEDRGAPNSEDRRGSDDAEEEASGSEPAETERGSDGIEAERDEDGGENGRENGPDDDTNDAPRHIEEDVEDAFASGRSSTEERSDRSARPRKERKRGQAAPTAHPETPTLFRDPGF